MFFEGKAREYMLAGGTFVQILMINIGIYFASSYNKFLSRLSQVHEMFFEGKAREYMLAGGTFVQILMINIGIYFASSYNNFWADYLKFMKCFSRAKLESTC